MTTLQEKQALAADSARFEEATIFASAAKGSGANNSSDTVSKGKGVVLYLDVTAVSGSSPTLDVKVAGKDPASGDYFDIAGAVFAQKTGVSAASLTIYPGIAETANVSVSFVMPMTYRVIGTVGGSSTPTVTFSLGAVSIP
jgi:hypothetical protein